MTALIWMLTWLLQVLPAMSELPKPVNITLTSVYFSHTLKWEPGPGTPAGVHYKVAVITERGLYWVPVAGCEHVQHPLVCNLTEEAFSDPDDNYFIRVTAMLEGQNSSDSLRFSPKEDTHLDLPLLTVAPCDRNLCVHLQPPREHLRDIYETFSYKLRIKCNNADSIDQDTKLLRSQILTNLIPGRQCCVSIRFSVSVVRRISNYSQPVCAVTPGNYTADPWISVVPCLFVIFCLVIWTLLFFAGFIRCLIKNPLPLVLTSIRHLDEVLITTPQSASLSSLLNLKPTPPSSGEKRHSQTSSGDSDSKTESTGGSRGGGREEHYKLRVGTTLLSSSSSSSSSLSSLSAPLSPEPEPTPSFSSNQTSNFVSPQPAALMETEQSASDPPASCLTGGRVEPNKKEEEEEEEEEEEGSLDVNLLTLTFGPHEDEVEEEEKSDVESSSASEVCNTALILPAQTWDTEEAALETVPCAVNVEEDEEEDDEEEDEDCGYMGRPSAQVLRNLL